MTTATEAPRSLAGLLCFVEATPLLDSRAKREAASAIRSLGTWLGKPLESIPTAPAALRRLLETVHPAAVGISKRRFANVRSMVNRVLSLAGVRPPNRPVAEALSPRWRALFEPLRTRYLRTSLAPFARFCTERGIDPDSVSDEVSSDYLRYLEQHSRVKHPRRTHQTVARTWNQARRDVPGWPDITLTVPRYATYYTLTLHAFPTPLREDVERYLARLACEHPIDLLDETAPPRSLKKSSIKTKRYQVRQFASALVLTGLPIAEINSLAKLVTLANFKRALKFFLERPRRERDNTRTAGQIAHAIRSIAKHFLKLPESDLVAFGRITARLNQRAPGMTEGNRRKLVQFDDETVLRRFLSLPPTEIEKLQRAGIKTRRQAVTFSLLVALETLIFAPMRVSNLAALRLDEHIRFPRDPNGEAVILLPRNIVKNEQPLQYLLPPEVTALLLEYVDNVKPMLEPEPSPFLFPGGKRRPKRSDTLSKQLSAMVWDRLGIQFSPHLIRHLTAKMHVDERPGNYEAPRRLLGHRSYDVTFTAYSGCETRSANRLHDELIRGKRASQPPRQRTPVRQPPKAPSDNAPP